MHVALIFIHRQNEEDPDDAAAWPSSSTALPLSSNTPSPTPYVMSDVPIATGGDGSS